MRVACHRGEEVSDDEYTCGICGKPYPDRDAYITHLTQWHPETWLAKRSLKEQALREKKQRGTPQ
jgi:hypothetical protein